MNMRRNVPQNEQEIFTALDLNSCLRHPGPPGKLWIAPEAREVANAAPAWLSEKAERR